MPASPQTIALTGISADASYAGDLNASQTVAFTLTLPSAVQVTGSPVLLLSNGATATYDAAASTSTSLVFGYTVGAGQDTADLMVSSLSLNGGTIGAPGGFSLAPTASYAVGASPYSVATADVNADGKPDLVVANNSDNTVSVLLGDGSGGFGAATSYAVRANPVSVATADVNADGKPDIVVANSGDNTVSVLLGDGSGGFGTAASYAVGSNPYSVATADVNADGKPDLVVAIAGNNTVSVLLNDGSGGFGAAASYAVGSGPASVATADVNADGKPDLVVANSSDNTVSVLLNDGSGGFGAAASYAVGFLPFLVATADVNADGKPDIVTANAVDNTVSVLLGDGSGGFGTAASYAVGSAPLSVATADVNADGNVDLVVANGGDNTVSILLGDGSGGFGAGSNYAAGFNPQSVATVDVNADGKLDIVTADSNGNTVSILLNTSAPSATFDAAGVATAAGRDTGLVVDTVAPTVASPTLAAAPNGAAIALGVNAPTDPTHTASQLAITVGALPANGVVTLADGVTPVTAGQALTPAQLAGLLFTPAIGQSSASAAFTYSVADPAGNASTGTVTLAIAPVAASGLTLAPASDSGVTGDRLTSQATPEITGTGTAGDTVTLYDGAGTTPIGTAVVGVGGTWSITPTTPLANGPHSLTARQSYAGNLSAASAALVLTIDATTPLAPAMPALASASDTGVPGDNRTTATTPAITGTGATGNTVTLYDGATPIGTAVVGAGGTWSITPTTALAYGSHALTTTQASPAGNASAASAALALDIDIAMTGISAVASRPGVLNAPQTVTFTLATASAVQVTGSPTLLLSNGAAATYDAAASTGTSLVFSYTVATGQDTTDLMVSSLSLNGGTIGAPGGLSLAPVSSYAVGTSPFSVAVADVDADGKPDIVTANSSDNTVSVLLGDGSGGFGAASNYAAGFNPRSIATADVNADGKPDIVTANSSDNTVSVLLNDGSGGFGAASNYAVGTNPYSVATADVNADGKPDIVTANLVDNTVSVLLGDGSGGFGSAASYAVGSTPVSVATADVNADGKPDLVVANAAGDTVSVVLGDGSGGFGAATSHAVGSIPYSVATADVNADGKPDIVTANNGNNTVSVLLGDGSGGFGSASNYAVGSGPFSIATADVNGDGRRDLVTTNNGDSTVSVLLGDGSGGFGAAIPYAVGTSPVSVAAADVNGDGKADIFTTNNGDSAVSVLLNSSTSVVNASLETTGTGTAAGRDTGLVVDTIAPTVASPTLAAAPNGAAIALGVNAPTDPTHTASQLAITAGVLPANGVVTLADGVTPVTAGQALTPAQLAGLLFTPAIGQSSASAAFTYSVADPAGNASTGTVTLAIAPVAASGLTLAPASDSGVTGDRLTSQATPEITGTGTAGDTVTLYDGAGTTPIGTAVVGVGGTWSITPTTPLANGPHSLTARQSYAGNLSAASAALALTIDATTPLAPAMPALASASDTGVPGDNRTTATTPAITGTGATGNTVTLYDGATPIGTAVVGAGGTWSITPTTALAYGSHALTTTQASPAGNASAASAALALDIDIAMTGISAVASRPGVLNAPQTVTFTLATASAVQVTGSPTLLLSNGAAATYDAAASTGTSLVFGYTVAAGQDTTDLMVSSLSLNGGTIAAPGGLSLAPVSSYATGTAPRAVATTDVNADGKPDLVVANYGDNTVSVLLGDGSGGFGAATSYAVGANPQSVATADVNADGNADLVVANANGDTVSILLNDGSGGFGAAINYAAGSGPASVATADVDADGKPDLVVANATGNMVSILLNDGSGGFGAAINYAAGSNPFSVATADVNADGKPDIVTANQNDDTVSILLNDGSGGFGTAASYAVGSRPSSVATADVNADGNSDLVAANAGDNTVSVLLGDGSGGFGAATTYAVGFIPVSIATADVNADGKPDLVVAIAGDSTVSVLLGDGSGGFGAATSYASGSGPASVAVADVDADGKPDIVTANFNGNTISVLLNSSTSAGMLDTASTGTIAGHDTELEVDTIAPAAPVLTSPDLTDNAAPMIGGTAEAGSTVTLTIGGATYATVATGGVWSVPLDTATPDSGSLSLDVNGVNDVSATATDPAGNASDPAAQTLTIDTTAPVAPANLALASGSDSGVPGDGITSVHRPTITGSGGSGNTVTLFDGGVAIGTATVFEGGWSITPELALIAGSHSLTVRQTDPAGNLSVASSVLPLFIDATPPAAPSGLALAAGSDSGTLGDGITSATRPVLVGTGEAGNTVRIYAGTTQVGSTTVASNGTWSFSPDLTLTDGTYNPTATQTDPAGNVSAASPAFALTIDATPPAVTAALAANPHNTAGRVYNQLLNGGGDANATVTIRDDGVIVGTAQADATGVWSFDLVGLAAGNHSLVASEADAAGNAGVSAAVPLTVAPSVVPDTRFSLSTGSPLTSGAFFGSDYTGGAMGLQAQYGYVGTDNVTISANVANVFIYGGAGDDAVVAKAGSNVLDGGGGSNWMIGASGADGGTDTFFVNNTTSQTTWNTLLNFHVGDMLTIWDFNPLAGSVAFADDLGQPGYTGLTLEAALGNGSGASDLATFAGLSSASAQLVTSTGTAGGLNYLAVTRVA